MQKQFGSSNATVFRQTLSTVAARHTESDVHAAQATAYVHDYFLKFHGIAVACLQNQSLSIQVKCIKVAFVRHQKLD